jgi:hypothetical protein
MELDNFTKQLLERWAFRRDAKRKDEIVKACKFIVQRYPSLLDEGWSWDRILDLAINEGLFVENPEEAPEPQPAKK